MAAPVQVSSSYSGNPKAGGALTFIGPVTALNSIVLLVGGVNYYSSTGITDSSGVAKSGIGDSLNGNTGYQVAHTSIDSSFGSWWVQVYILPSTLAGTLAFNIKSYFGDQIFGIAYECPPLTATPDANVSNNTANVAATSGVNTDTLTTSTLAQAAEIAFAVLMCRDSNGTCTLTVPSGFTGVSYNGGGALATSPTGAGYKAISATTALSASWTSQATGTVNATPSGGRMALVTFKTAGGGGGSTYNVTQAETGTAADSASATGATSAAQVEAGAGADTTNAARSTNAAQTEAGNAADSTAAGAQLAVIQAETGAGADTSDAARLTIATQAETGNAADTVSALMSASVSQVEAATANDGTNATKATSATQAEAGNASDTQSTGAQTVSVTQTEAGNASDATGATASTNASQVETGAAVALSDSARSTNASQVETANANATTSAGTQFAVSQAETANASDTTTASAVFAAFLVERGAAVDTSGAVAIYTLAQVEAGAAIDTSSALGSLVIDPEQIVEEAARLRFIEESPRVRFIEG
jgi:hypothetical protein